MNVEEEKRFKTKISKDEVKACLKELGLKEGDIIGVHSSLGSFGYVEGGADALIDALLEVVGEEGTVVMPTYSTNRIMVELEPEEIAAGVSWVCKILPYDLRETSCWTGIVPETFRKRKGVVRSRHPLFSVAAIGPKAGEIVEAGHRKNLESWRKLLELGGYVLLIGVGLEVCTAMHLAEETVRFPKHILEKIASPKWLVEKYPSPEWDFDVGPYPEFSKMEEPCLKRRIMKTTKVGQSTLKLVRLRDLIRLYAEYLEKDPDRFYA